MKLIQFPSSDVVHAADIALAPFCGQTNEDGGANTQQIMAGEPTCWRCKKHLATLRAAEAGEAEIVNRKS